MPIDFETALRNAEGVLSVARDNQKMYEDLATRWRRETEVNQRVLDRLREVAGVPLDTPIKRQEGLRRETPPDPTPMPSSRPLLPESKKEVPVVKIVEPPLSVAALAAASGTVRSNGYDRLAAKRQLRDWGVSWPLPKSYRTPSQLARQALTYELVRHDDYSSKWLGLGHVHLTDNVGTTMDVIKNCAHVLGVNADAIYQKAYRLQRDIDTYGERGIDYKW